MTEVPECTDNELRSIYFLEVKVSVVQMTCLWAKSCWEPPETTECGLQKSTSPNCHDELDVMIFVTDVGIVLTLTYNLEGEIWCSGCLLLLMIC